jgi:hypothetical protein
MLGLTVLSDRAPLQRVAAEIGAVDDPLEKEADRVADQVMRSTEPGLAAPPADPPIDTSGPTVMRAPAISILRSPAKTAGAHAENMCPECEEEEEKKVQTKAESGSVPDVAPSHLMAPLGGGLALDRSARTFFEGRFVQDFSGVRVHDGPSADVAARSIGARAFTLGRDIVFRSSAYAPSSLEAQFLLAHELTHVVQQGAVQTAFDDARPSPSPRGEGRLQRAPSKEDAVIAPFPAMTRIVQSPTVEEAREADWEQCVKDFKERGAWIRWAWDGDGETDHAHYQLVPWPTLDVGAHDDEPEQNPQDAIDPGTPPADDSLWFLVGHYHHHPPLDPAAHRDPKNFPVGPSPQDWSIANKLGNPGVVRDFTDITRTVVKDYLYGPPVEQHK